MDWREIAIGFGTLLSMAYGYLFVRVVSDQKRLEERMTTHEEATAEKLSALPDKYVRRDDLSEWKGQVLATLARIEQKLDGKQDKP